MDGVWLLTLTEEENDDPVVVLVWDVVVVDEEISDSVTVTISVSSGLVKLWVELSELNVGDDDDELDWEVEISSDTSSLEREIELLVWMLVSVDNVDCNELISDSDTVTISVASVVTVDGILSVKVCTVAVVDAVMNGVVSIDDWLTVLDWNTVDDSVVNVDSELDTVSISSVVAVDKYVWLVLWTVVVRVTLISVSDIISKVKKIVSFKIFYWRWLLSVILNNFAKMLIASVCLKCILPVVTVDSVDAWVGICEELVAETEIVPTEDVSAVLSETSPTISVSEDVAVDVWDVNKVVDASVSLTISVTIKYQIHNQYIFRKT